MWTHPSREIWVIYIYNDLIVIEDEHLDLHVQTLWDCIQAWEYFMLVVIVIIMIVISIDIAFFVLIISAIKITIKFSATDVQK